MEGGTHVKTVFVTVGTTSFDKLIQTVTRPEILTIIKKQGYKKLTLQIGRGDFVPETETSNGLTVEYFRYKDSIADCFRNCDLVISHAGAGSCLEALGAKKPLLVVINEELMGNHQIELAHQLYKEGHLFYCTCQELEEKLKTLDINSLVPFEPGKPEKFVAFLDKVMGVA